MTVAVYHRASRRKEEEEDEEEAFTSPSVEMRPVERLCILSAFGGAELSLEV